MRALFFIISVSFLLHSAWEYAHIGLYTGYEMLEGVLPVWVYATIGDVFYTVVAVSIVTAFKPTLNWIYTTSLQDYVGLAVLGCGIALLVEYKALALHRWAYLPNMPMVPYLEIGLSPLLQMILLLPLSVYIASRLYRKG